MTEGTTVIPIPTDLAPQALALIATVRIVHHLEVGAFLLRIPILQVRAHRDHEAALLRSVADRVVLDETMIAGGHGHVRHLAGHSLLVAMISEVIADARRAGRDMIHIHARRAFEIGHRCRLEIRHQRAAGACALHCGLIIDMTSLALVLRVLTAAILLSAITVIFVAAALPRDVIEWILIPLIPGDVGRLLKAGLLHPMMRQAGSPSPPHVAPPHPRYTQVELRLFPRIAL